MKQVACISAWILFKREVGMAQSVRRRATGWTNGIRLPARQHFSLLQGYQADSRAKPASYTMSDGDDFPSDKAAGTWSWPLTSN
jgi:hypothetical protein